MLAFIMIGAGACEDGFDELAQNPNAPSDVPADLVIAGAQVDLSYYTSYQLGVNYLGMWVQHHGSGAYPEQDQYSPRLNDINVYWDNLYDNSMRDFKHVLEKSEESGNVNQRALALIMSAFGYMSISDVWGDVPYSEALRAQEGITTPTLDPQGTVYDGIIKDLDDAVNIMDFDITDGVGAEDLVYRGDMRKWERFANSLRLRAFIHLSKVDPAKAQAGIVEMLGKPLISSHDETAALHYSINAGNKNPVHSRHVGRENDFRVSLSITSRMIGPGTKADPLDPRLEVYAQRNDVGVFEGVPNGIDGLAEVGLTNESASKIGELYLRADAPAYFLTYTEVEFIRAEAAHNGWISDDPQTAYENAIRVSMSQNGITDDAVIDAFLADPTIAYSQAEGTRLIAEQKWIALYGQSIEAWTNWRRTGFPDLPVALNDQNNGQIPRRLMYGSVEAATNATNVQVATERQGGAELSNRVWWDQE